MKKNDHPPYLPQMKSTGEMVSWRGAEVDQESDAKHEEIGR
jgi:hypothetical protein